MSVKLSLIATLIGIVFSNLVKNIIMSSISTLSEKINALKSEGFTEDFDVKDDLIVNYKAKTSYTTDQINVLSHYRFEGATNPSDNSIIYVIETEEGKKGVLVDGYGTSSDMSLALAQKLK
ncbi:phosphoribosylpyrophosphate synthetase [Psychroflexus maritimus]|uniref:Phosphoribosylpyrophosphate synthetase n=1 Tax=Psychroflexus maritimus TaxID=2714865 RepID=A0A967AFP9_9FLAO|nr:phosphoribosylpyrophosphate synthetase [Psychroflexus maritimus]NGZ90713.1 phosphoribosylpyrophosphate synthetase [Psychroflexus maritimus]